jgi:glycosyltransferase involved in cell wall biosynthesis
MNSLRPVVVTPRYWPLVGPPEHGLAGLIGEWLEQGARPTVVTASWSPSWPREVFHSEVPVVRLPGFPQGGWANVRYFRELTQWLRKHESQIDLALVANLRQDAYTTMAALAPHGTPVVLQAERFGADGDCQWQETHHFGRRIRKRCWQCDAVVAGSPAEASELRQAGFPSERIAHLPPGVALPAVRTAAQRGQARASLGDINHDMIVPDGAPVALCIDRLERPNGIFDLVKAWQRVVDRWPSAALWIIGDGTARIELYEWVVDLGLHRQILFPGSFDDLEDVMQAADLFVAPSPQPGISIQTLQAMAAGLPVVAIATDDNRATIEAEGEGLLVPPQDPAALDGAIRRLLDAPAVSSRLGAAARRRAAHEFPRSATAARYLNLFEELAVGERGVG